MIVLRVVFQIVKIIIFLYYSIYGTIIYAIILLNSSYDVSRELFVEINNNFVQYWKTLYPEEDALIIRQSHTGSTRQAIAVLQGLRADVVTYNQITDVQILCDYKKLIPKNWKDRLPNNSSPFYSTMAFLVRKGNPKNIHDWKDLTQSELKIVFSNPKTSGNGRYAYLAAWHVFFQNSCKDIVQTRIWMKKFLKNVIVFDIGGRSATTTFIDRNQGDVLINFESELKSIKKQSICNSYEIIVPNPNILAEFPVTWIDKNVIRNGTQKVAQAYLNYLYTDEAQKIISKFGYRIHATDIKDINRCEFSDVQLFRIEDQYYGDWNTIMKIHFSRGGEFDRLLSIG